MLPYLAAGLGGAVLLVAIILLAVLGGGDEDENETVRKAPPHKRPAARGPITTPRVGPPSSKPVSEAPEDAKPEDLQPTEPETVPMVPGTETPEDTTELPGTTDVDSPTDSTLTPTEPKPGDVSKPPGTATPSDPFEGSPEAKKEVPQVDPEPKTVPQTPGQPGPTEVAALATALKSARAKLENSDFDGALAELAKVESLPKLPEHQAKYQRLRLLTEYAGRFQSALAEALKNLEAGDLISSGPNSAAGVVTVTADQITLKINGQNRKYAIKDMSPGLAVAIADTWLDKNDPVCLVAKAAYLASLKDARDDRLAKAREWFQEASNRGVDIGDLGKAIDDQYDDLERDLDP